MGNGKICPGLEPKFKRPTHYPGQALLAATLPVRCDGRAAKPVSELKPPCAIESPLFRGLPDNGCHRGGRVPRGPIVALFSSGLACHRVVGDWPRNAAGSADRRLQWVNSSQTLCQAALASGRLLRALFSNARESRRLVVGAPTAALSLGIVGEPAAAEMRLNGAGEQA